MFLLRRLLPLLLMPVCVTLALLLAGLLTKRRWMTAAGAGVLWLSATPLIGFWLQRSLESGAERIEAEQARVADAIVVLSEGRVQAPGAAQVSEWNDADRFFAGVELARAAKAPLLVFTGARAPGDTSRPSEGALLAQYAVQVGIDSSRVLVTSTVFNTADEAAAVAALLHAKNLIARRILLVTSAAHMARARRRFERCGFTVVPFPVDFRVDAHRGLRFIDLVPSAAGLGASESALRELYGRLWYDLAY